MKASEIEDLWRIEMDDTVLPFLWSPEEALDYMNDAQNEAGRRTRAFVDSSTTACCSLTVTTSGLVTLDPRVLFVRQARIANQMPMRRMNMQDMAGCDPMWQDAGASTYPLMFITDYETGKLMFHPKPAASVTVLLTVVRDPLVPIASRDSTPELNARYHRTLRHWMAYRAYSKPDAETYRPDAAKQQLALFEQEFGQKSSAIDELWIQREQYEGDGTY